MKANYASITVSRQEIEQLLHYARVYGNTGCYCGIERLFRRRHGLLLEKMEAALESCAPAPKSRPNRFRIMRKRAKAWRRLVDEEHTNGAVA